MHFAGTFYVAAVWLCVATASVARGDERLDLLGDPLPPGAVARMGTSRLRHTNSIYSACFHPDGKLLASSGADGSVRLWDVETGRPVRRQKFDGNFIHQVTFSPDGRRYLVIDGNGALILCDTESGRRLHAIGDRDFRCAAACFAPDGRSLAVAAAGGVQLWRIEDGPIKKVWMRSGVYGHVDFAPDGAWIAAADLKVIRRLQADTGKVVKEMIGHQARIRSIDVSPDGRRIASAAEDSTVRLWNAESGEELWRREQAHGPSDASCVEFSPDGETLLSAGYDHSLRFWDAADGEPMRRFDGPFQRGACWSPDGKLVASWGGNERAIRIRVAETGEERPALPGHGFPPWQITFLGGGERLATACSNDDSLRIWNPQTGRQLHAWTEDLASAMAPVRGTDFIMATGRNRFARFDVSTGEKLEVAAAEEPQLIRYWTPAVSPDGTRMVTVVSSTRRVEQEERPRFQHEYELVTWKMPRCRRLASISAGAETRHTMFLPDGKHFICLTSEEKTQRLQIRSFDDLAQVQTVYEQVGDFDHHVFDVAVSPDGTLAALARNEGGVVLIGLPEGKIHHKWTSEEFYARHVEFSADGKRLLGGNHKYHVWETETGRLVRRIVVPQSDCGALSSDGRRLAAGDRQGTVSLWDVASGELLVELRGHKARVSAVRFAPDGKRLVSASSDCTLLSWSLDPADWPRAADAEEPVALGDLWEQLGAPQAESAYEAARQMIDRPVETLRFLRSQLPREVKLPAGRTFDDPGLLRHYRAAYVLEQIEGPDAQALRNRIRREPPPKLGPYVAEDRTDPLGDPLPEGAVLRMGTDRYYVGTSKYSLAFSPDGKRIAAVTRDRVSRRDEALTYLFDGHTGEMLAAILVPRIFNAETLFTPDGERIVIASSDRIVLVDVENRAVDQTWEIAAGRGYVVAADISPDGRTVVVGDSRGGVAAWDTATGRKSADTTLLDYVTQVHHLEEGTRVAVTAYDDDHRREAGIWDYAAGRWESRRTLDEDELAFAVSSDGETHAVASKDAAIRLTTADESRTIKTIRVSDGPAVPRLRGATLRFSHNGRRILALTGDRRLFVFDCRTGAELLVTRYSSGPAAISRDGRYVAVGGTTRLRVWDLDQGVNRTAAIVDKSPEGSLLASADGATLLCQRGSQRWLCDRATLEPVTSLAFANTITAVSPDGRFCTTSTRSQDEHVVWELATQTVLRRIPRGRIYASSIVFGDDGRRLAISDRFKVATFDLLSGEPPALLEGKSRDRVLVSPDGSTAMTTDLRRRKITVRDAQTGDVLWETTQRLLAQPHFSGDGRRMAAFVDRDNLAIFDARTGKQIQKLPFDGRIAAVSPRLALFAVTTDEGKVQVYETATAQPACELEGGTGLRASFLPDGRRLTVRAGSGTTTVWDLAFLAAPRLEGESVRKQLERLWPDLKAGDARRGLAAVFAYAAAGDKAVDFLRAQFFRESPDEAEIRRLARQLDNDRFKAREEATQRLIAHGAVVVEVLDEVLAETSSVEVRTRIERIKKSIAGREASHLLSRAVMILDQIATPAAAKLRRELAALR